MGLLGSGGFGVVFRALNLEDKMEYAVKRIQLGNENDKNKVREEIRSLAQLRNCAQIVGYNHVWYESVKIELQVSFCNCIVIENQFFICL